MILIDSSVWIDYFNGIPSAETDALDRLLRDEIVLVADLILAEVLQGFREDRDFELALEALWALQPVEMVSPALAVQSARNYRALRKQGITVRKTIDCLIATYCIEQGVTLLHKDQDFDPFEARLGLNVLHPPATKP